MDNSVRLTVEEPITDRQRVTLLAVSVAGHAVKHLFSAAFFVLLPEVKTGLGLSNVQVGTLSTIRVIGGGLSNLPAGFVADRFAWGRSVILGLCIALIGVFALGLGMATSFGLAVLAATLMNMAINFWHPSAISSLSQRFAGRRGFAIALHGAGGSTGETLGPIATGFLLTAVSWRVVLQGSVVPAVVIGFSIWLILRSIPMGESGFSSVRMYLSSVGRLLMNRRLLLVLLFAGSFSGGQSAVTTFLPIYLREDLGFSSVTLGLYLSLAQVAGIGSQPLMGYLSDRLGRKVILVPGLTILGLAYLGLSLVPSGWPLALVVLAMGAFLFSLMAILLAAAMDLVPEDVQATTVSLVFGSAVVVSGFSPAVAGLLADAYGVKAAFLLASAFVLTAAMVAAMSRWQRDT